MYIVTVVRSSNPYDAAGEQSVVSCPQYGEMGHGGTSRDTPVQDGLQYLGFEHPYFEHPYFEPE